MQTTFGVIMLALVDRAPRVLTLREMIQNILNTAMRLLVAAQSLTSGRGRSAAHILEATLLHSTTSTRSSS